MTTRAVILQTYRYSDTSKILRLMTREHGPRSAIARGALRPRSRFGGLLEPFAEGVATLYVKENRDLDTLSAFDLTVERQGLGRELERFTGAAVLCELVMRLAPEHRDDRLYAALTHGLDALLAAPPGSGTAAALHQVWRLVSVLGFEPDFRLCLECGRPVPEGEGGRFDEGAGGLRCDRCSPHGVRLAPDQLASLRLLAGEGVTARAAAGEEENGHPMEVRGPQGPLLADFIRRHLAEGAELRSLAFLRRLS